MTRRLLLPLLLAAALAPAAARPLLEPRRRPSPPPVLTLPVACRLGEDCAIQSYQDHGAAGVPADYLCRWRTYVGHNGTDFRIASLERMRQGVAVLAAAPGRVLRVRDGVADVSVRDRGTAAMADQECGNGLVVAHAHGWETQYCHLRRGSLRVKAGAHVRAGQPLGLVGLSGDTEFPHLHLTVRHDGQLVDPFADGAAPGQCGGGRALWRERIPYQSGQAFTWGFATRPPSLADAQAQGPAQVPVLTRAGPALVAWVQGIGLKRGDIQRLALVGPDGHVVASADAPPLDHDKAEAIWAVGRRAPPGGWPAGVYQGSWALRRDGVDVANRTFRITL